MKCFTLRQQIFIVQGGTPAGFGATAVSERYPTATPGIALNGNREVSLMGLAQLKVDDALLRLSDGSAIKRQGRDITLLRASIETKPSGERVLVPEREDDRDGAIICVSVGGASYLYHEADEAVVMARATDDSGRWGRNEELIVALKPFQRVSAIRRDRKWIFWGEMRTRERLNISFDGTTVFYDVVPPKRSDW